MRDSNALIESLLKSQPGIAALVGARIYCPKLPKSVTLPAISFLTRGGTADTYAKGLVKPSVQFSCWDDSPEGARAVYGALYDALHGYEGTSILSALEEMQGQDLQDPEVADFYQVLTFYQFVIAA